MRTPVVLVAGQGDTDAVAGVLLRRPGTVVVEHRFDGQVVRRTLVVLRDGDLVVAEEALELAHGCLACTIRNDLLVLLRKLHRRGDVDRIVVHLAPWLEPEPICWAINHTRVRVGPGYFDGPAARDVVIAGVVNCVETVDWLGQALGDDELSDGRTVAQVVVGQAEFADLLVLNHPDPATLAVLRRWRPARASPSASTASRWRWRTWTTTHAAAAAIIRMPHYWPACRRWLPTARSGFSSSVPAGHFTRSGCMPRSMCCSTASFARAVDSGWPTGATRSCGWNRPAVVCGSPRPESGWRP